MRLATWIRRLVGLALIGWSSWTLFRAGWRAVAPHPYHEVHLAFDRDTLEPVDVRIVPLSRSETRAAIALEDRLLREPSVAT